MSKNSKVGTKTYLELISQDSKEVAQEQLSFTAQEAQHTVSVAVLETEKAIFKAKKDLSNAQKAQPYNLQTEIDLIIRIDSLEEGLAIAKEIKETRFKV